MKAFIVATKWAASNVDGICPNCSKCTGSRKAEVEAWLEGAAPMTSKQKVQKVGFRAKSPGLHVHADAGICINLLCNKGNSL